ncbi:electron transfer flavoprotein alpha subunit apoprotein [Clostridium amylolyticum]|uniref:Electron transfer flavoprotein alpha subunit apoprotein n=1 Tax=Clostridium amylolyticum TaxID=1121298 RepID=A0A1M6F9L4_9CLOT|nr:electron transfer flavoprotein subunit alpha/FixB family protein [Clostridium amylolyticum]SHI94428.1 electron transfer flavoprotein alpha subunit apoprotein [Clostridium amylolyticum]
MERLLNDKVKDKDSWKGITVIVDHIDGKINPITFELLGKAKELAEKSNSSLYAVFMGHNIKNSSMELLHYGVEEIFIYEDSELKYFRSEPYTSCLEDFINKVKPSVILSASTVNGKVLASRIAARFKTGLAADCTTLDIDESSELLQIRPTYGGSIMAEIITANTRPQIATVKPQIFSMPQRNEIPNGKVTSCNPPALTSGINILEVSKKYKEIGISEAEILVAVGRGVRTQRDMRMAVELAEALGAELAVTRPLTEMGWADTSRQIGVSGKIVKPKLIITLGISGAIQFTIGMNKAEYIIAVNTDEKAPIFKLAHYGIVGDIYEVVPHLIKLIKGQEEV